MRDFKKHIVDYKQPRFFVADASQLPPDLRHMGIFLLTKVIPQMDAEGDMAFYWAWAAKDIGVYNQSEYDEETRRYKKEHKMKMSKGDTTYFYEFKNKDGKMRRCILTTEIWFKEDEHHRLSPVAMLMGQMFGNGLHITKCRFEDA